MSHPFSTDGFSSVREFLYSAGCARRSVHGEQRTRAADRMLAGLRPRSLRPTWKTGWPCARPARRCAGGCPRSRCALTCKPCPRRLRKHRGAAVDAGLGGRPPVAGPGAGSTVALACGCREASRRCRSTSRFASRRLGIPSPSYCRSPFSDLELEEEAVKELHKIWGEPRTVLFSFSWISARACAFLAADDSAAACRLLASAHAAGWYSDRALHISL